jgi:hypothetical protein
MGRILPQILSLVAVLLLPSMPAFSQFAGPTLMQPSPPPSQKKAPVAERAVKTCQAYGAGYMWVEGTGSCVKIGGYVRAQGTR